MSSRSYSRMAFVGLLTAFVVMAGVGPYLVGPAAAAGPTSYEYTGGAETLVVDTSALDTGTEFTVEYTTQEGPSTGTTILARETYNTANLDGDELWFYNRGAYDSVNVTVSDYSGGEPAFDTRSAFTSVTLGKTIVGSTGGDSDLQCGVTEQITSATNPVTQLDCTPQPGSTSVNTTNLDAQQVETDLYQSALNEQVTFDTTETVLNNYLQDTETQAKIIGKNAYIRSLNNGSSQSAARVDATRAVNDYYAVKQRNLYSAWNGQAANGEYITSVAKNEAGVADNFTNQLDPRNLQYITGTDYANVTDWNKTQSETLVNGETMQVRGIEAEVYDGGTPSTDNHVFTPTSGDTIMQVGTNDVGPITGVSVTAPTTDEDKLQYIDFSAYAQLDSDITNQSDSVNAEIETLVNNTYSEYQQGEINNTDLIDPYLADQEFSPSNSQTWVAAQLSLLGTGTPENFDQIGAFNVSTSSGDYRGVLLSQENPASGQFENGTTYDAAAISGTQYVVTPDETKELTGNFTITAIEDKDGATLDNVTINTVDYSTTNVTELQEQYDDLALRYAELEARQAALAGGGGLSDIAGGSTIALVAIAGAALLILRN